jgi:hypothetical protein
MSPVEPSAERRSLTENGPFFVMSTPKNLAIGPPVGYPVGRVRRCPKRWSRRHVQEFFFDVEACRSCLVEACRSGLVFCTFFGSCALPFLALGLVPFFGALSAFLVRTAAHLRIRLQEGSGYSAEPVGMRGRLKGGLEPAAPSNRAHLRARPIEVGAFEDRRPALGVWVGDLVGVAHRRARGLVG